MNIQDVFLNQVRKEKVNVVIECHNGERHTGCVKGFDNFCVLLQTPEGPYLIYKHALAKIIPPREFILKAPEQRDIPRKF